MRKRIMSAGAVQVVLHDHSPSRYVDLIQEAEKIDRAVKLRGDTYAYLVGAEALRDSKGRVRAVGGFVATFTQIDSNDEWINIKTRKKLAPDSAAIPKLGEARPHGRYHHYYFSVPDHQFVIETRGAEGTLSPASVLKMLNQLFEVPKLAKQFGQVELTVIPEPSEVDKLIAQPSMRKMLIRVTRPNADDQSEAEKKVMERMRQENVRRREETLVATDDKPLKPDQETQQLARVAARNGDVTVFARENGKVVERSTREIPLQRSVDYLPDKESGLVVFHRLCDLILGASRSGKP